MVGPVPASSSLAIERADHVTAPGYMQLSGTSFAAPVVAGAAAQILVSHPGFTPDQIKGALMVSAKSVGDAVPGSVGVGELQMGRAALMSNPPNPNKGLDRFLVSDPTGGNTPGLQRRQLVRHGEGERLLGLGFVGLGLLGGPQHESRLLGGCVLDGRLLGGCVLGRRLLGRRLLE